MNMANDHNQQNRPNIFGPDFNYPPPNAEWNRFVASSTYYEHPNFPFSSNFGPSPVTFPIQPAQVITPSFTSFPSTSSTDSLSEYSAAFQRCKQMRCKRKTDSPLPTMNKQHITEEKMAEHLAKLHISSETPARNEPEERRVKRLYMCDEMRKLQSESILPSSLLNKIQRPCTALVLWQPPQRLVPAADVNENSNNNNEEVPDHNLMETDGR
ncbi:PREDICTED: uncharacterized protein LOC108562160 [Nicrophorus vespilloides]|uniref:Uncharacterized protein LOC108562160 n=1 Tax=Nicrophorus vespilloides TaxID=110193 RepID=A0ABM1MMS5_NICVS|nr:PREDICTED: uncharacterized protein LOC108562160 [Nicrophorus vespilloides]